MRQGGAVAREMSSGNQVRVGQLGATSRTCSSSSLSLHSVCASRLTGGNAYLRKPPRPAVCQCSLCRGGPRSGKCTAGSGRRRGSYCHPQISQSVSRRSSACRDTSTYGGRGCQSFHKGKARSQRNHAHTPTTGA